jgi:hypothetical protein
MLSMHTHGRSIFTFKDFCILALVFFSLLPVDAFCDRPPSKKHSTFYDYLTSTEFACSIEKRIFKPGTIVDKYDFKSAVPACLLSVSCQPAKGIEARSFTAGTYCLAADGVCEEPIDCARRTAKVFGGQSLPVSSKPEATSNKHNDICWETNGKKDVRGTIQILSESKVLEEACVAIYACKQRPAPALAVCPMVAKGESDLAKSECPLLNDCINKDVSLPGFTEKELDEMPESERARIMRQYEDGVEKLASSVSKDSSSITRQAANTPPLGSTPVHAPKK